MRYLLDACYAITLLLVSPWILWRVVVKKKNRRGWGAKLLGNVPRRRSTHKCLWLHAVSVGEVNLLGPFVQQFRQQHAHCDLAISTSTETGFDLARRKFPDAIVFFCPLDFSWAISRLLDRLRPDLLLLTEVELWPNLIGIAHSHGVGVGLINGRISPTSFRGYRRLKPLFAPLLRRLRFAAVQTESYAARLVAIGMPTEKIHVCGNMKFDCAAIQVNPQRIAELRRWGRIAEDESVFVAGSTQEDEDRMLLAAYAEIRCLFPRARLVLVPRDPQRCDRLVQLIQNVGLPMVRRTEPGSTASHEGESCPVIVVDVIGELRDWWGLADAGFVGGSFGKRGGQSMIEPAGAGVPVCFGPKTENFRDVVALLLERQGAEVVSGEDELLDFWRRSLSEQSVAKEMGERAESVVQQQRGGAARVLHIVDRYFVGAATPDGDVLNAA